MRLGKWLVAAALLVMWTSAIASHDPRMHFSGDYWDEPGPGELVKVGFAGNRASQSETAVPFILLRVAELARQRHKPYFRLFYTLADAILNKPLSESDVRGTYAGADGWVFVLFDDADELGDLSTQGTLDEFGPIVHKSGVGS